MRTLFLTMMLFALGVGGASAQTMELKPLASMSVEEINRAINETKPGDEEKLIELHEELHNRWLATEDAYDAFIFALTGKTRDCYYFDKERGTYIAPESPEGKAYFERGETCHVPDYW